MSEQQLSQPAPAMSWDDAEDSADQEKDFLAGTQAEAVPQACSIDNPDCEACQ
ncbi:hypothetical protein HNP46_000356 [Pseudomonas nitritireducens]|uniref:Uncharacterized protein n=1 Tax=Pseudomonas nitroreducens TaxID=46680 RepID=A0A7W7NZP9_PSENT|nr:hypothetical protein [Pseudomonas nitritireducens]MBB4861545.1 hypothetical protein [Pseudomonas nitritireducens]